MTDNLSPTDDPGMAFTGTIASAPEPYELDGAPAQIFALTIDGPEPTTVRVVAPSSDALDLAELGARRQVLGNCLDQSGDCRVSRRRRGEPSGCPRRDQFRHLPDTQRHAAGRNSHQHDDPRAALWGPLVFHRAHPLAGMSVLVPIICVLLTAQLAAFGWIMSKIVALTSAVAALTEKMGALPRQPEVPKTTLGTLSLQERLENAQ
jgi:hypothetical protein